MASRLAEKRSRLLGGAGGGVSDAARVREPFVVSVREPPPQALVSTPTRLEQAEEAARLAQQQHEAAQRRSAEIIASVDGIVWEADAQTFQFTFVSAQAERMLGYPIARWFDEPSFWADHIHPDDRKFALGYCLACTREMKDHRFDYRLRAADGRYL